MIGDATQHIREPGLGIDAVEFAVASGNRSRPRAAIGAGEQPRAAPEGNAAQRALSGIVRQADAAVVEKADEGRPALEQFFLETSKASA
jgi:hypothetical protein